MSDQAQPTGGQEASLSPEIADAFGIKVENQAPQPSLEKVASDSKENKEAVADTTKENSSDKPETPKEPKAEDKKTETTEADKGEDGTEKKPDAAQPTEFEVAGTKYSTFDEAVKAVNRINGANTKMSGDVKVLRTEKIGLENKVGELEKLLSDYKKANEDWQKYYDGEGEKPDQTKVNIEEAITKTLSERESRKEQESKKTQYTEELDTVFAEEDFEKVKPFFQELVDEYDGVPKVGPKKLYERARVLYKQSLGTNELKDIEAIDKQVEDRVKKELAKKEAAKANSASGGSSNSDPDPFKGLSPEVADYLKQRM